MNEMTWPAKPVPGLMDTLAELAGELRFFDEPHAAAIDRRVRARLAELSNGFSMLQIALAWTDWASHLAISPGKLWQLNEALLAKLAALGVYNAGTLLGLKARPPARLADNRLAGANWKRWPFSAMAQGWLVSKEYWQAATDGVEGARPENLELMAFVFKQMLEAMSPANFAMTNPDVLEATVRERGANLVRGLSHAAQDLRRRRDGGLPPGAEQYRVGEEVACTPGKVVYQNRLVELIQYAPTTARVDAEPVFFVPAWIGKYYILDLSPQNSMVRYLVGQGKTVFMLSWKNPGPGDSMLGMEDYLALGVLEPLAVVNTIVPGRKVDAVGYCIGGTLLYIAAAHLAGPQERFNSLTIFAAQADFTEAGEIRALLGESMFAQLEALMHKRGGLKAAQMAGAFAALRSGDRIWGPAVDRYLLGKEPPMSELLAWNADGTRMPHRMHSQYLRALYLDNDLAEGRFKVQGRTICVGDITAPIFVVGTVTDHVAPWKSVYRIHRLNAGDITFLLTTGGHTAGIVSGPVHPRRKHQIHTRKRGDRYTDPETWQAAVPVQDGSWWPVWVEWLKARSSGQANAPAMGAPRKGYRRLRDAPGDYVLMR